MKKSLVVLAGTCLLSWSLVGLGVSPKTKTDYAVQDSGHQDGRKTPKLEFDPAYNLRGDFSDADLARAYLRSYSARYRLPADLSNLELATVRQSLRGAHYHFQQMVNGIALDKAEIIVSISRENQRIYRVFNNTHPITKVPAKARTTVSQTLAYDTAWNSLKVRGKLMAAPKISLKYVMVEKLPVLVYGVELSVEAPHGAWLVLVDAQSAKVVATENRILPRAKHVHGKEEKRASGPLLDRVKSFNQYDQAQAKQRKAWTRAAGTGLVFDPDPRTTLMDNSLKDDSPAASFDAAYFSRTLLDIGFADGVYGLVGPWVQIVDFESPTNAPSTTTDGNWTAKRGDNAFNDVMTYYHLDKNQRYMQSLGFTGEKGIQAGSIQVDSDGYGGSDNSYFSPSENKIAFGHGCVDDNEDADVILHEYGHAIHHSINSNWSGGDTGGMGEGFGDYWAASYSLSTPNGSLFKTNEVFTWDGHGGGSPCWPGRVLDAFGAQYNPNKSYGAHQTIEGGFQSDELWSTPLFQALLALTNAGVPRETVDAIILEAHFGLGSGLRMPEMAGAILATAQSMQDDRAISDTLLAQFVKHKILKVPTPALQAMTVEIVDSGNNGMVDPGEAVELSIPLKNVGTATGTGISAVLTSANPQVVVTGAEVTYANLAMGEVASASMPFAIEVASDFPCGEEIELNLHVDFDKARAFSTDVTLRIPTGKAIGAALAVTPALAIPDNDASGITSEITLDAEGLVGKNLQVELDITHPYRGDLTVKLQSPSGTEVVLHDESGGSADNLVGTYPETLTSAEPLSVLENESLMGVWKLFVADGASSDAGKLNAWGIRAVTGFSCQ